MQILLIHEHTSLLIGYENYYKCSIYIHIICTATWTLLFLHSEEQNLVYDGTHLQKIMSEDQSKSLFDSAYHIINIKSQSKLSEQSLLQFCLISH